jgi:hypothetical protein
LGKVSVSFLLGHFAAGFVFIARAAFSIIIGSLLRFGNGLLRLLAYGFVHKQRITRAALLLYHSFINPKKTNMVNKRVGTTPSKKIKAPALAARGLST